MSLRLRRGPSTDRISIVFQAGELVYDTTEKRLYVGDDLTQGGVPVSDLLSDLSPQLGGNLDLNGEDIIGFGNINIDGDITATGTLTVPSIITDITGSIFGDDSTPLVDGANSKIVLENNSLSDLGDVTAPTQDKQILEWNSLTNTWDSKNFNLNDYVFNSSEGSYLRFNGISWVASYLNDSVYSQNNRILVNAETEVLYLGANSLSDLGDVTDPTQDKQILEWNSLTNTWDSKNFNLNDYVFNSSEGSYLRFNGISWVASYLNDSVYSQNSRILVNAETEVLYLGANRLADIGDVFLPGTINHGSILKYNSTTENWEADSSGLVGNLNDLSDVNNNAVPILGDVLTWDGQEWTFLQPLNIGYGTILDTDIQGSVYGLDSSIIVDAATNTITISEIQGNPVFFDDSIDFTVNKIKKKVATDSINLRANLSLTRASTLLDLTNSNNPHGSILFGVDDLAGLRNTAQILAGNNSLTFVASTNSSWDAERSMYLIDTDPTNASLSGYLGLGTYAPEEKLHVKGNVKAEGFVQFGTYANATARDAAISSPTAGMVIFLADDGSSGGAPAVPKFQGYDGSAWINLS